MPFFLDTLHGSKPYFGQEPLSVLFQVTAVNAQGLIADWNAAHTEHAVCAGDSIACVHADPHNPRPRHFDSTEGGRTSIAEGMRNKTMLAQSNLSCLQ